MDESSDMEQDRENVKQSINNGDTESAFECRSIRCSKRFHDEEYFLCMRRNVEEVN